MSYRIKWEALGYKEVRKNFASSISFKFRQLPTASEDIEKEWLLFRSAIISSAAESCGQKSLRVAGECEKRTSWWNQVLLEYGVDGQLLRTIKSFHCQPEVCVRVNGKQLKPFNVGVGLRQECVLSPLLFIVYMNWIDKCSQADKCAMIGNCKISCLLFADGLFLLFFTESGLQRALINFANVSDAARMKISTAKTEVLRLSRNPD